MIVIIVDNWRIFLYIKLDSAGRHVVMMQMPRKIRRSHVREFLQQIYSLKLSKTVRI